jgi:proprotein convertase subtilisin/kexin type 5
MTMTGDCQLCDATCATCTGGSSNNCLTCKANGQIVNGGCVCVAGYYMDSTGTCKRCDLSCQTCNGGTVNSCLLCNTNALIQTDRSCKCLTGYTYNPTTGACNAITCHNTCFTCNNPTSTGCTQCKTGAFADQRPVHLCYRIYNGYCYWKLCGFWMPYHLPNLRKFECQRM